MKIIFILFVILVIITVSYGRDSNIRKSIHRGIQNHRNGLVTHKHHHDTVGDDGDAYDDPDDDYYDDDSDDSFDNGNDDSDKNNDNDSYEDTDGNNDRRGRNFRKSTEQHSDTHNRYDDQVIRYYHDTIGGSDEDNSDNDSYDDSDDVTDEDSKEHGGMGNLQSFTF